jgi:hypothetical protein
MCREKIIALVNVQKPTSQIKPGTDRVRVSDIHGSSQDGVNELVAQRTIHPVRVGRLRVPLPPVEAMDGLLRCQVMINTHAEIRLKV